MKADKVREMSVTDLVAREKELEDQLMKLRFQKAIGQLESGLKVRATRRERARVKTILKEKQAASARS